jgi:hypothetical protein
VGECNRDITEGDREGEGEGEGDGDGDENGADGADDFGAATVRAGFEGLGACAGFAAVTNERGRGALDPEYDDADGLGGSETSISSAFGLKSSSSPLWMALWAAPWMGFFGGLPLRLGGPAVAASAGTGALVIGLWDFCWREADGPGSLFLAVILNFVLPFIFIRSAIDMNGDPDAATTGGGAGADVGTEFRGGRPRRLGASA